MTDLNLFTVITVSIFFYCSDGVVAVGSSLIRSISVTRHQSLNHDLSLLDKWAAFSTVFFSFLNLRMLIARIWWWILRFTCFEAFFLGCFKVLKTIIYRRIFVWVANGAWILMDCVIFIGSLFIQVHHDCWSWLQLCLTNDDCWIVQALWHLSCNH